MTNTTTKTAMDEHNKSKSNEKKKKNKKKMKKNKGTVEKGEEEQLSVEDEKEKEKEEEEEYYKCRGEVVKRRSKRLKELTKIYREYYWCLIEQLNLKHSHFLWNFPTTPYSTATNHDDIINNNNNNNNNNGCCEVHSCKNKAMALTRFCHSHILSDANQLLYKPCNYPTKCSPSGPTLCMKPILKSAVPSLCSNHLEKAEKHLSRCLRKEGFTGSNKYPLKFNVIVSEFVRQIQSNRKENL